MPAVQPAPVSIAANPAAIQAPVAQIQPAPAPLYAPAPTASVPAASNPFTAPPASVPMESFQSVAPVTTSTLPAYSPASTLPPQAPPKHNHSLVSPLLDRHPGTAGDAQSPDELETLFSGVHTQQHHLDLGGLLQVAAKKTPSFYIMIGFMAGAVFSLLSVWGYSSVTTHLAKGNDNSGKEIVTKVQEAQKEQNLVVQSVDPNAEIVPISSSYEVKSGDTLVVIAMKNYKKVTPRLIDQIVKANGLKSANALSLGQSLKLPNYRNQSSKLAHRTAAAARARQVQ
jgi:LysM domain.